MSAAPHWPDWDATPPPDGDPELCRHCEAIITVASVTVDGVPLFWADANGVMVCKKRAPGEPYLTHEPMPAVAP